MIRKDLTDLVNPRSSTDKRSDLEVMNELSLNEDTYYRKLKQKYGIVVEQCKVCWRIGKHVTAKCCQDKPICPRCGSEEGHARELCFVMCFRCGEVGMEASHESCPKRRAEILRQALMKKYGFDAKLCREISKGKLTIEEALTAVKTSSDSNTSSA